MNKATLILLLTFSFMGQYVQAQPEPEKKNRRIESNSTNYNPNMAYDITSSPPDEDDDLDEGNPNVPIDGGIIWMILSAVGLASGKFKSHIKPFFRRK